MQSALQIRRITHADLAHCAAIDGHTPEGRPTGHGESYERFLDWPCQGGFVALWHGSIVGFALYHAHREHRRLCLVRIGVASSWQRRHVGSYLVQHLRRWLSPMPDVPLWIMAHERDLGL